MIFSTQHVPGYTQDAESVISSTATDVLATQRFRDGAHGHSAPCSFTVSGDVEAMESYARFLRGLADDIELECERVIGRRSDERDEEMRRAEEDERDQFNIAKQQGY